MKTQRIKSTTFSDSKFIRIGKNARYLWLYLLASEQNNLSGIFESSLELLSRETGLSDKEIETVFKIYEKENMAYFFNDYVILKNGIMNNTLTNTNIVTGIFNQVNDLPDSVKKFIKELDNELTWAIEGKFNVDLTITRKQLYYSRSHAGKHDRSHAKKADSSYLNSNSNLDSNSNLHLNEEWSDEFSAIFEDIEKDYSLLKKDLRYLKEIAKTESGREEISLIYKKITLNDEIEDIGAYLITCLKGDKK